MTKAKRWSYSAGIRGVNRVRAFEGATALLFIEFRERGESGGKLVRRRQSLGHRDRHLAEQQAENIAASLNSGPVGITTGDITLGQLFDIYEGEVTPRKGAEKQAHDRRTARMFLGLYGRSRPAMTLNLRDWDRFIDLRRSGRIGHGDEPKPVGNRQIEYDLKWLRGMLRWATQAGFDGSPLLERNPLTGYPPFADIEFLDSQGKLVARIEDYECVVDAALEKAFRANRIAEAR